MYSGGPAGLDKFSSLNIFSSRQFPAVAVDLHPELLGKLFHYCISLGAACCVADAGDIRFENWIALDVSKYVISVDTEGEVKRIGNSGILVLLKRR